MLQLFFLVSFFTGFANNLISQEDKADKYMKNHLYLEAINSYKKAINKQESGTLHQKIGKAYIYLKDYSNADIHYKKSLELGNSNDSSFFEYGKVLVILNHKKEAKKYFDQYLKAYPKDFDAASYISSFDSIYNLKPSLVKNYKIEKLKGGINLENSKFGAIPYNNGLLYISEGNSDLTNHKKAKTNHNNYFSIFYSEKTASGYEEGQIFDSKITSDWHDGSVTITPDGKEIYFSTTYRNNKTEVMHLYSCSIENGKLSKPQPFLYNNNEYSIMHPAFSSDGKKIFFASNNKNGKGGWDIYYCKKDRKYGWSAPQPINGLINTAGNEVFPHYHNGKLYFSSDGHFGYGSLDLFVANENEYYRKVKNLGTPINSSKDDLSIYYSNKKEGFFSSNRETGTDKIYTFKELAPLVKTDANTATITGIFELKKLGMPNTELIIYDEQGNEIDRIMTDKDGRFIFKKLKQGQNYSIKLAKELDDADLFITNSKGEKVLLLKDNGKHFIFKALETNYTENLFPIEEEEPTFLITPIKGHVFKNTPGDLNNRTEIKVYDDDGKLIGRTYTNKDGSFFFKTLTPQNNYHFEIENFNKLQLSIKTRDGKDLILPKNKTTAKYIYQRIKNGDDGILLVNENNQLIRIKQNEKFTIGNILYETNSAEIGIDSKIELHKLYVLYRKNNHLSFIIESHTDSKGSDKYNLKLSIKRAKRVVDYLIEKGIPKEKLIAKGYGEQKLLNKCGNNSNCSGKDHAINRRTEIKLKGNTTTF